MDPSKITKHNYNYNTKFQERKNNTHAQQKLLVILNRTFKLLHNKLMNSVFEFIEDEEDLNSKF